MVEREADTVVTPKIIDKVFYLSLPYADGPLDPSMVKLAVKVTFEGGKVAGNTIEIPLEELQRLVQQVSGVFYGG